jgi:DNA-binding LacI/PurR family transcriptional regulator
VSLVLNRSPGAASIPKETQDRVFEAAKRLNYRPSFLARSLGSQRTYLVGVTAPELGEGYASLVLNGIEVRRSGYQPSPQSRPDRGPHLLYERCVEGVIAVDTPMRDELPIPVVSISGHRRVPGVSNIVLITIGLPSWACAT